MRKLVLTALLLVCVGALSVAWLSSASPAGSPIGDVDLAEERRPRSGTNRLGVPPRQASTSPARSSLTPGGGAATTPESLPVPELTIASSNERPGGYDASATRRRYSSNDNASFGSRIRRSSSGSSGSSGFSSGGMGVGGVGGGGGAGAAAAPSNGNQGSTTTFQNQKAPAERATPPAARPTPPRSGSGPAPGGGSVGGGGSAAPPAAAVTPGVAAFGPAPAIAPIEAPPFSPGGSPSPAATPEPTTMLLLGTGIAGLYRLRRYLE
jgi:hypothetical protein